MKIAIAINSDFPAYHHRKGLISALVGRGHDVTIMTPDGPFVPKLEALGAKVANIPCDRHMNPLRDIRLCLALYRQLRKEKPDIVHTISVKLNTYGAVVAWLAGVPKIVSLLCGIGYGFAEVHTFRHAVIRFIVSRLYWLAGKVVDRTWFQNPDDLELFVDRGLISREKAVLIRSSGVDIREFSPDNVDHNAVAAVRNECGIDDSTTVVLMMVSRITWSKGVKEFIEASEAAQAWRSQAKFVLVGPLAPNEPDAVPEEYLNERKSNTFVPLTGFRSDVKEILAMADIVVQPSIWREGVPRIVIEAMAMQKPIVTTDQVGCRETVEEGENGFLVPVEDSRALASRIERLVDDPILRSSCGRRSREMAETEFAQSVVVQRVLSDLYGLDADPAKESLTDHRRAA